MSLSRHAATRPTLVAILLVATGVFANAQNTLFTNIEMTEILSPEELSTQDIPSSDTTTAFPQLSKLVGGGEIIAQNTTQKISTQEYGLPGRSIEVNLIRSTRQLELRLPLEQPSGRTGTEAMLSELHAHVGNGRRGFLVFTDKQLAFVRILPAESSSETDLKDACRDLVSLAFETNSLAAMDSQVSTPARMATSKTLRLNGTWSARISAEEAWAIRFVNDAMFTMVHTRGEKNSISRGNFEQTRDHLKLTENGGLVLGGTLSGNSDSFRWTLGNGRVLNFDKQTNP